MSVNRNQIKRIIFIFMAFLLCLYLVGCQSNDKVLSSQENINNRLDTLTTTVDQIRVTRVDFIRVFFDSLAAYNYASVSIDVDTSSVEHEHVDIRYLEYYSFLSNPNALWDGDYFFRRVITDNFTEFTSENSIHKNIGTPVIYNSYGKYRILNERDIDLLRVGGSSYNLRTQSFIELDRSLLNVTKYILSGDEIYFGDDRGGVRFNITHLKNYLLLERGDLDY